MFSTDPQQRKEYTSGLRQLADFLDAHPGIPVPGHGTEILVSLPDVEDGGREEVRHVCCCGPGGRYEEAGNGTVETYWIFGPVSYKVYALTKERVNRYRAASSYDGCVTPDD